MAREPVTVNCGYAPCGREFSYIPAGGRHRTFCSPGCANRHKHTDPTFRERTGWGAQWRRQGGRPNAAQLKALEGARRARHARYWTRRWDHLVMFFAWLGLRVIIDSLWPGVYGPDMGVREP